MLKRILSGEDAYDAIRAVTGLKRGAFVWAARADAERRLRALIDDMPEAYREGIARSCSAIRIEGHAAPK